MVSPVETMPRRANRAGTRRRATILQVAEQLVAERGHPNVTVQMVADAAGITQPAVHHHFTTRDDLFLELLKFRETNAPERAIPDTLDAMVQAIGTSESTPKLVALYADYATRAQDPEHPSHAYFRDRYRAVITGLTEAVEVRQRDGRMDPQLEPVSVARILLSVADGLQTHWLIDPTIQMRVEFESAVARFRA